ncbi:hypothetical protein NYE24_00510 [Paenibacillus sp. FSL H7-0350]|uniref:hypothetical protein n=1 Tax=Paenibacillus sp. FSL H7-0350 TaxID=2975345 RepID=UPI003158F1ED
MQDKYRQLVAEATKRTTTTERVIAIREELKQLRRAMRPPRESHRQMKSIQQTKSRIKKEEAKVIPTRVVKNELISNHIINHYNDAYYDVEQYKSLDHVFSVNRKMANSE